MDVLLVRQRAVGAADILGSASNFWVAPSHAVSAEGDSWASGGAVNLDGMSSKHECASHDALGAGS